jgi:NADH-quinone oxidoreductase subunit A
MIDPGNAEGSYITAFGEVLLYIVAGIVFSMVSFLVARTLRPHRPNLEKLTTYESGEEPVTSAWSQFNIRFYILALIFILFEVEILFLFPWTTVFARPDLLDGTDAMWGWFAVVEVVLFVAVLFIGLVYAWVNGHLDWIKPDPQPTRVVTPVPSDLYLKINERYAGQRPAAPTSELK